MVNPSWESFSKLNQGINKEKVQIEIKPNFDQEKPEGEKPQWGNFQNTSTYQGKEDPTIDEDTFGYLARNIVQTGSRVLEQGLGRYGNVEKVGKEVLTNFPVSGGVLGWALEKLIGPEKWERMIKGPQGNQKQVFPTSEQLKEVSQKVTNEYTKPKTKGEERFQEKVENIASTFSPSTRFTTPTRAILNHFVTPVAAGIAKDVVEDLGFGKDKANLAQMAVAIPLSLAFNVNAPQFASNLMNKGRNGIPDNINIDLPRFQSRLKTLLKNSNMLLSDPRSALARQQIAAIENDLANGQTSVRSMMNSYDGLNAAKRNRDLFNMNRSDRNFARARIDEVRDVMRDEIMQSGSAYPDAINSWREGIGAWAAIHQSRALTSWIQDLAQGPYAKILTGPVAGLFGIGSIGAYKTPLIAGPLSATAPAIYKTGQTFHRMWNNEQLRNYYFHAIGDAQKQNIPSFINNYLKLEKGLENSNSIKPKSKSKEK